MTAVLFISLIVLLIIGVPIAFVLCGSSILAILASGDIHSAIVIQRMFSGCGSFIWEKISSGWVETEKVW